MKLTPDDWKPQFQELGTIIVEEAPAEAPFSTDDDDLLHFYRGMEFPVALCGAICLKYATWAEAARNRSTAGKDRCSECLRIARALGITII